MSAGLKKLDLDPELKKRLEELSKKIKELQEAIEKFRKELGTPTKEGKSLG